MNNFAFVVILLALSATPTFAASCEDEFAACVSDTKTLHATEKLGCKADIAWALYDCQDVLLTASVNCNLDVESHESCVAEGKTLKATCLYEWGLPEYKQECAQYVSEGYKFLKGYCKEAKRHCDLTGIFDTE